MIGSIGTRGTHTKPGKRDLKERRALVEGGLAAPGCAIEGRTCRNLFKHSTLVEYDRTSYILLGESIITLIG